MEINKISTYIEVFVFISDEQFNKASQESFGDEDTGQHFALIEQVDHLEWHFERMAQWAGQDGCFVAAFLDERPIF